MRVKKCLYLIVILLFILCGCENKPNEQPDEPKKEAYLKVHYIVGKDDDELVDVIKTSEELASYELKTVTKTGHVFMGWYQTAEGTDLYAGINGTVTTGDDPGGYG